MNKKYRIFNEDSLKYFNRIETNSVDFIFTDPPYNLKKYSTGNIKFSHRSDINNDIADWDRDFDPLDYKDEFLRVIRPTGNIFAFTAYNTLGRWHEIFDPIFDTFQFFVWHKTNPTPKFMKAGFLNSCGALSTIWGLNAKVMCLVGQIARKLQGKKLGVLHEIPDQMGIMERP